jgi:ribonucleoside-diphosphate reductase alpha chain
MTGNHARNVTCSSIAPTGTLTLMFRDTAFSYGIEPAFFLYYWKRTRMAGKYEYYFNVPKVVREAFEAAGFRIPMDSDTVKDDWDGKQGKAIVKFIEENKEKVGIKFKTSTQITAMDKLQFMAQVMKWVDSSISVTYMLPEGSTWKDVFNFIIEAHHKEVKSIAAFPDKKMYGIVSEIPFKELALGLQEQGVSIHHQNFDDNELKVMNISRENIKSQTNSAPKRLDTLDADIYVVSVKNEKFCIVIGLQNGQPYEIFGGHLNGLGLKSNFKKGKIIKVKKSQYALEFDDIYIEDFSKQFTPTEQILFRMTSTSLRHGVPIQFVVDQLQKATQDITSMGAAAARCLKKYIKDGEKVHNQSCPQCGNGLVFMEGCVTCSTCGYSRCS